MQTLGVRWSGWFSREHWQWVPRGISELSVGGSNLTSMGYRKRNIPPLFLSPPPSTQQSFTLWGGGGGGGPPRSNLLPFICTFIWQKRDPFRISSIDKWCHLHVRTFERSTPFNCCKCSVFWDMKNKTEHKTRKFFWLSFTAINSSLSLLGLFTDVKTNFPTLSYTSTS